MKCLDIFARSLGTDQGELYEAGTKNKKTLCLIRQVSQLCNILMRYFRCLTSLVKLGPTPLFRYFLA